MFHKGGRGKPRGFGFGGFAVASKPKEPQKVHVSPAAAVLAGRVPPATGRTSSYSSSDRFPLPGQRRPLFVDSDDEEDERKYDDGENEVNYKPDQPYDPSDATAADDDDEEDELDKFMAGIESQVKSQNNLSEAQRAEKEKKKIVRDDIEEEDDQESYFNYMKNAPVLSLDEEEDLEYDSDGNPIVPEKSKIIEPLPRIDHSEIDYAPFEKNFYVEHENISRLNEHEIQELRNKLGIKVSGAQPPRPCISFAHFGFDEQLMASIRKLEYTQPTPIQCQAVPVALSGRDVIGIAKTGSGKTAAFLWPALVHIMDQAELEQGDGPIALICAPTRELCQQIYVEARRFGRVYNIKACAVFGGGNKYEQSKALQGCPEIVVATPGRLIDHVKSKSTNLQRVTYLVFDEADRMFDMGFEPQVRSIANNVRPDRQTLLFSATFKKRIEKLCREILIDPIRVVIGELGEANEDIAQSVKIFNAGSEKWGWLLERLVSFTSNGSVLIFVTKKLNSEELSSNLKKNDFDVVLLHGDMDQFERNNVINAFKKKEVPIMVATDVAARGLDIPSIKTVINYDVARDIHTHTHRIGRTGRAGEKGEAYTLMTSADQNFAGDLVRNLEGANQPVPEQLMDLAMKSSWFRKTRFRGGRGKQRERGSDKPRVRERPGLGMADKDDEQEPKHQSPSAGASSFRPGGNKPSSGVFSRDARSDRQAALKQAFQAQYKSHFKAASSATTWDATGAHSTAKPAPPPKPKKSRWDTGT